MSSNVFASALDAAAKQSAGETVDDLLPALMDKLSAKLSESGLDIIDNAPLLASASYKAAKEDPLLAAGGIITLQDYKLLSVNNAKQFQAIAAENSLGGGVYAFAKFDKMMSGGIGLNGSAKAAITLNLFILNKNGKIVFQKSFFGTSKKTFTVIAGIYDVKELMYLFPEAMDTVSAKVRASFN
jgi:hypothetical protein